MFRSQFMRARLGPSLMVMLVVGVGACDALDKLLEVETPSEVVASDLTEPGAAELLTRSAANEFRCAHTHYVNVGGNIGWELRGLHNGGNKAYYDSRGWGPQGWPAGAYARAECGSGNAAHYLTLSKARWIADDVLGRLDGWGAAVSNKTEFDAELNLWAAYSYHYFGVSMCTVAFDEGPEQQPAAAATLAVARFDAAIAAASSAGRDDILNAARIGKGRVLLFMGDSQGAAAAVAGVPAGFLFELEYSNLDATTRNRVYYDNVELEDFGVGLRYQDLRWQGVSDPRVPVQDEGKDVAGYGVPYWTTQKYSSSSDPLPLARYAETQLITAEAEMDNGQLVNAINIINTFHAANALPLVPLTASAAEVRDAIIYNRRAELFLEGQHFEDLKRFDLGLFPAAGEPFALGGVFGAQDCFPLPLEETANNPNIG